jgi:hypothetical protein
MMSRLFCHSVQLMVRQIEWIWGHHDSIGLWDFGPRSTSSTFMPLADDWRSKEQRRIDWSTRVLILASSNLRAQL